MSKVQTIGGIEGLKESMKHSMVVDWSRQLCGLEGHNKLVVTINFNI